MNKKQIILGAIVLAAFIAIIIWGRDRIHFDFAVFRAQIAEANWWRIALALVCIYIGYLFRAARWAWLLRHDKKVSTFSLIGSQVIGFTAIALIGRIADPVRPYLVSKKTGLPLSNQIAVYIVERLFDLGSTALIFSVAILMLAPGAAHVNTHHGSGFLTRFLAHFPALLPIIEKFGGLILTFFAALFLILVRFAGATVAAYAESFFGRFSKSFGKAVAHKIHSFRSGLNVMRSFSDFAVTVSLSLVMWGLITVAYLEIMLAFSASPQLAAMTLPKSVMLMMASGAASAFQLPILGWFTQIGVVAAAMSSFYGVSTESATACAATLLLVTFLGVVPFGLIWAQFEHVSLRKVAVESEVASEHAEEELEEEAEK